MVRFLLILLILLTFPAAAFGLTSAPNSHATLSPDGSRLLVMLSPIVEDDRTPTTTLPDGRVVDLRNTLGKSGVYDVSTLAPLWQVEWFAFKPDLLWSSDFRHVVRRNRHGFRSNWALAFFDEGKLIGKYDCAELLTGMRRDWCLPYSSWDWHVQWYDDFEVSADGRRVLLSTALRQVWIGGHGIRPTL